MALPTPDVIETIFQSLHSLGHPPGTVKPSTHLQDELGIDSLETVELSAVVCQRLGLPSRVAADVRNVHTVEELAARITPLLAEGNGDTGASP
ncbi:acyl carrier protein [Corallococcus sp. Z5C101001]|uniref:acyl carrier protein n=1 Tax=Corallococcus sp. Z5C101001 TaxID=2596829 RepID=UPI00117DC838|nr:acyl carrier protein [Corallococcus sp. Z5C101001]TSC33545.1 acyl carrier protein [Corallococcus sp. Z5C101001]